MATRVQRKIKGLRSFTVTDKTTLPGTLLVLPTPTSPELDPGITQLLGLTKNDLGETVTESVEISGQQPLLTATFPNLSPALLSLRYMKQLATATGEPFAVEKTIRVTKNTLDGAPSGAFGNGMAADQPGSIASVLGALGQSTPLTRLAYTGFDSTGTTDSFGQGPDGALVFSDNLIGSDVTFSLPNTQTGLKLSETPITELEINMLVLMSDLTLFRVSIPGVQTDLEASANLPLDGGEFAMTFRPIFSGVGCVPVEFSLIDQVVAC